MNKKQVQRRVLQNGKPLALSKFEWCEKSKTFSTYEGNCVIDFNCIDNCTFNAGWDCTFKTGSDCTFETGWDCTFNTGPNCTFDTGWRCTFDTGPDCTFKTGSNCAFKTDWGCTFNTGPDCTFNTGWDCTFNTGPDCTFNTGWRCTFKTGPDCTFNTDSDCTFDTGADCTFNTGSDCTFDTRSGCTFDTRSGCTFSAGRNCVIVRRDIFTVIQPKKDETIHLCPRDIEGYLVNGTKDDEPHIIADGILSKVLNQKGDVYKVINHGEAEPSWLIKEGDTYAHGKTLKEARESLVYKRKPRDLSEYDGVTLDTVMTFAECVKFYRAVTGACASGCEYFAKQNGFDTSKSFTVAELLGATEQQYGHRRLKEFLA